MRNYLTRPSHQLFKLKSSLLLCFSYVHYSVKQKWKRVMLFLHIWPSNNHAHWITCHRCCFISVNSRLLGVPFTLVIYWVNVFVTGCSTPHTDLYTYCVTQTLFNVCFFFVSLDMKSSTLYASNMWNSICLVSWSWIQFFVYYACFHEIKFHQSKTYSILILRSSSTCIVAVTVPTTLVSLPNDIIT